MSISSLSTQADVAELIGQLEKIEASLSELEEKRAAIQAQIEKIGRQARHKNGVIKESQTMAAQAQRLMAIMSFNGALTHQHGEEGAACIDVMGTALKQLRESFSAIWVSDLEPVPMTPETTAIASTVASAATVLSDDLQPPQVSQPPAQAATQTPNSAATYLDPQLPISPADMAAVLAMPIPAPVFDIYQERGEPSPGLLHNRTSILPVQPVDEDDGPPPMVSNDFFNDSAAEALHSPETLKAPPAIVAPEVEVPDFAATREQPPQIQDAQEAQDAHPVDFILESGELFMQTVQGSQDHVLLAPPQNLDATSLW